MTRFALGLIRLLQFLPLVLLAPLGRGLGLVLYLLVRERRHVTLTNLRMCFPHWDEQRRRRTARRHFQAFGRSMLEHGILWWGSAQRVRKLVRIEGGEHALGDGRRPVIWLAPHFVGLDMGGIRLALDHRVASMYARQKNPVLDAAIFRGRTRFIEPALFSRQEGMRPVIRALRSRLPFYYLPDMDLGRRDSIFVPFFGVPTATVTALPRLARVTQAQVVPVVTRQLPGGGGYVLRFFPPWTDFPTDDVEADTRRMNTFIEERVREMPEQYFWLHKRFKTRPEGEAGFY